MIAYCPEKQRLLEGFMEAMRELVMIQEWQIDGVIKGEPDNERFDVLIQQALEKKRHAKYAYIEHIQLHGC